jgi:hypothetical protein
MNHSFGKLGRRCLVLGRLGVCNADGCDDTLVARDETDSAARLRQQASSLQVAIA